MSVAPVIIGGGFTDGGTELYLGDCRDIMPGLAPVDSIVTDPPYEIGFMSQAWDKRGVAFDPATWAAIGDALKPGGYLLAFGGTRTAHRLACAIEDAGFEIRDTIAWIYGSGFAKGGLLKNRDDIEWCGCDDATSQHDLRSMRDADVSPTEYIAGQRRQVLQPGLSQSSPPAAERAARAEPETGQRAQSGVEGRLVHRAGQGLSDDPDAGPSASAEERVCGGAHTGRRAKAGAAAAARRGSASSQSRPGRQPAGQSEGLREPSGALDGRALPGCGACPRCGKLSKAFEDFASNLKPAFEPITVARKPLIGTVAENLLRYGTGALNIEACRIGTEGGITHHTRNGKPGTWSENRATGEVTINGGRWPANVAHDGSDEVLALFPQAGGGSAARFFKECPATDRELLLWRANAIMEGWNPELASTADNHSSLSREAAASVLSDAAIRASHGAMRVSDCRGQFTSATPRELRTLCESVIIAILSIEGGFWPESPRERLFPNSSRVSVAAAEGPTGTMTITVSRWRSDGSAVPVTLTCTPNNTAHGALGSVRRRAFFCAKADKHDRAGSQHPTVKPQALLRWLVQLVTPPGGTVLDPFAGSGSLAEAANSVGCKAIVIEREAKWFADARKRLLTA